MNKFITFPKPFQSRIMLTGLIGGGCFIFGLSYFLYFRDHIFLILSLMVFSISIYKSFSLFQIGKKGNYLTVKGYCVNVSRKFIGNYNNIEILSEDDTETTILLNKSCKIRIGEQYYFYFKFSKQVNLGLELLNARLSIDNFIGYEKI